MTALLSYDKALSDLLARLHPVEPVLLAAEEARGFFAAASVYAPHAVPMRAIALRDGHALRAEDLAGASSYAPVLLAAVPPFIRAGAPLPEGYDCLVEASGLDLDGPLPQALVESFPGENIRRAGEDVAGGALIVSEGACISALDSFILAQAGIGKIAVRAPVVSLQGAPELVAVARAHLHGVSFEGAPDLVMVLEDAPASAGLALEPGREISIVLAQGAPTIHVPARLDQLLAALHGFVLPALARLAGVERASLSLPLAQKVASRVGIAEIALLRAEAGRFHLLALGDLPLQSILSATHVSLIAASSEGHAAGDMISAFPVRA